MSDSSSTHQVVRWFADAATGSLRQSVGRPLSCYSSLLPSSAKTYIDMIWLSVAVQSLLRLSGCPSVLFLSFFLSFFLPSCKNKRDRASTHSRPTTDSALARLRYLHISGATGASGGRPCSLGGLFSRFGGGLVRQRRDQQVRTYVAM